MIQRLSHVTIYVLDQEEAKDFYVNKLGMDLKVDMTIENGFRWLTVSPKGQPDLELILSSTDPDSTFNEEESKILRSWVKAGKLVHGVFATADCQKTYEELKEKGVQFQKEPTQEFYGLEATVQDNSGNLYSMMSN
jgi:catechol 2,3-dioxygenase-like lactoylglutathione lyase family enzyme